MSCEAKECLLVKFLKKLMDLQVELMNMVENWRNKSDYGPVVVVSA